MLKLTGIFLVFCDFWNTSFKIINCKSYDNLMTNNSHGFIFVFCSTQFCHFKRKIVSRNSYLSLTCFISIHSVGNRILWECGGKSDTVASKVLHPTVPESFLEPTLGCPICCDSCGLAVLPINLWFPKQNVCLRHDSCRTTHSTVLLNHATAWTHCWHQGAIRSMFSQVLEFIQKRGSAPSSGSTESSFW